MTRLAIWLGLLLIVAWWLLASRKKGGQRRRTLRPGPGTTGTIYDMLNEDKRKALEIIVEQRAEERRPGPGWKPPGPRIAKRDQEPGTKDQGPRTKD